MHKIAILASFAARHALAMGVVAIVGCAFWTAAYFGLFLWAMVTGGGLGSPVAFPLGILVIIGGAVAAGFLWFLPATFLGEAFCRWRSWPTLAGIPVSFALFCILSFFWSSIAHPSPQFDKSSLWPLAFELIVVLAIPLGLYWWVAEFPHVIRDVIKIVVTRWNKKEKTGEPDGTTTLATPYR